MMAAKPELVVINNPDSVRTQALATTSHTPTSTAPAPVRLSDEQLAITQEVRLGKGNILVMARAGTGKTFLLRMCLPFMRGAIAVMAFNRKIMKELLKKIGEDGYLRSEADRKYNRPGVDVSTFNAAGFAVLRKFLPNVRVEGFDRGDAGFLKFTVIADRLDIPQPLRATVKRAMEFAQYRGFGIEGMIPLNDAAAWLDLAEHYGLESELPEDGSVLAQMLGVLGSDWRDGLVKICLRYAAKAINLSIKMTTEPFTREHQGKGKGPGEKFVGVISMTDMMYMPLQLKMPFNKHQWVLTDEAQDSNPIRREMAHRMLADDGRMLWVGDDRQSIYSFAGADSDALAQIGRLFACKIMPMTVTFRCAKAIVRKAQLIVSDYKAANDNPEGETSVMTDTDFAKLDLVTSRPGGTGDAIICRNTKPLISLAYKLIARGIPCHVEGREIGKNLISLLDRYPHLKTLPALTDKLVEYRDREVGKLLSNNHEAQADALEDKVETVLALIAGMPKGSKVADLTIKINGLFADTPDGEPMKTVTLVSGHKSKGLEFTRVFAWGNQKFIPSKYAKMSHQLEQEENLEYIIITRAILTLVDVIVSDDEESSLKKAA